MKKFLVFLKKNHIAEICINIFFSLIIYIIRDRYEFKPQTIAVINFLTVSALAMIFFYAVRNHYIRWHFILCVLSLFFVFNRFYEKDTFQKTFHFELFRFWIILGSATIFIIIYPVLKGIALRISNLFGKWTKRRGGENEQYKGKIINRRYGIRYGTRRTSRRSMENVMSEQQEGYQEEYKKAENADITLENPDELMQTESGAEGDTKKSMLTRGNIHIYTILIIIYFVSFIGIVFAWIFFWPPGKASNITNNLTSKNLPTAVLSIAMLIRFLVFIAGITISLLIKWIQIIAEVINNQRKGEMYFVYACALFLGSQYIFSNYSYTTDDLADLLLDGKLFTFPLILSVLIPVFLIFAENIVSFSKKNKLVEKALKKCAKKTIKIARSIVEALLTFIEFVTSDYLTTIIELTKEDDSNSEKNDLQKAKGGEDIV